MLFKNVICIFVLVLKQFKNINIFVILFTKDLIMKNETTNKKTSSNNEELLTNKKTSSNNEELLANNNIQYEEQCELINNIFNTYKTKIEKLEDKKRVKCTDKNLTREQIENAIKKEFELIQKDEEKFLKKVKATKEKINEINKGLIKSY